MDCPPGYSKAFIVPDLVLLVNGIPLVVVECKSPSVPEPLADAVDQLRRYSNQRRASGEVMAREPNDRAKASEMAHAIRAHLREHLDQDPVAYRKLSERLRDLLDQLGEQWDALSQALLGLADEIRSGPLPAAVGMPGLPEHCGPFLRLLVDATAGDRAISDAERHRLVGLAVAVVDSIKAELTVNFWRPNRQPAQDALGSHIFEILMAARLLSPAQIEALVDKLMALARANHAGLLKS